MKEVRKSEDTSGGSRRRQPLGIHVPTPCQGFWVVFPGREDECRGGGLKRPRSDFSTISDQGTAADDEEAASVGTPASPEEEAVLRAPYGWESKAC